MSSELNLYPPEGSWVCGKEGGGSAYCRDSRVHDLIHRSGGQFSLSVQNSLENSKTFNNDTILLIPN